MIENSNKAVITAKAERRLFIFLILLIVFFAFQRISMLEFASEHISSLLSDEMSSGAFAKDILEGKLRASIFSYQFEHRSGDSLLEGLLLIPFFCVFGESLFVFKLFCISSALLSLILGCWFINRYWGIIPCIIFVLLFTFSPPMFARMNFVGTIGMHHLINSVIALQLILLFRMLEDEKQKGWKWLSFGFLAGLGFFLFYTYIIFNLFCLLFIFTFRVKLFSIRNLVFFVTGSIAGALPWLIRTVYNFYGGVYLASTIKDISFNPWKFIQNFIFMIPHSFNYSYPERTIGIVSILFTLFIAFCGIIIFFQIYKLIDFINIKTVYAQFNKMPLSALTGIFVLLFPVFFITCLTLAPQQILPFDNCPGIGFFSFFPPGDLYRYRWLYLLFPFYFAIISIGSAIIISTSGKTALSKIALAGCVIFFCTISIFKIATMYSSKNAGILFSYRGYGYNLMSFRLISATDKKELANTLKRVKDFPADGRHEAYRKFGAVTVKALSNNTTGQGTEFKKLLKTIPSEYMDDFIWGVCLASYGLPGNKFESFSLIMKNAYPDLFYINWGFRRLGFKYYKLMINKNVLLENLSNSEMWYYSSYIKNFFGSRQYTYSDLIDEIYSTPVKYQRSLVKGIGKLIGNQMLADPLHLPEYPLSLELGNVLDNKLKQSFYKGIGIGFCDIFLRACRAMLPPEDSSLMKHEEAIEKEKQKYLSLLLKLPQDHQAVIHNGFVSEIQKKHPDSYIESILLKSFNPINKHNNYLLPEKKEPGS